MARECEEKVSGCLNGSMTLFLDESYMSQTFRALISNVITPQIEEDINLVCQEVTRPSGRSTGVSGLKSSLNTAALFPEKKRGHSLIVSEERGRLYTGYLKSQILNHAH